MTTGRRRFPARCLGRLLGLSALVCCIFCVGQAEAAGAAYRLEPVAFSDLPGFAEDPLDGALEAFNKSCAAPARSAPVVTMLNIGALRKACAVASQPEARRHPRWFFQHYFQPYRIGSDTGGEAFFTGYFQPEIPGSLTQNTSFPVPVYGLPPDLATLPSKDRVGPLADLTAARRDAAGNLSPYPDRGAILDGALEKTPGIRKLLFLRDNVDLFLAQVQGSARVRLPDGRLVHLAFAGRNGQPYTALARILVQRGVAPASEMTMPRLVAWLRTNGLARGEAGDALLRLNRSYVFFDARLARKPGEQPAGGSGASLSPLRSVAIDSHVWPYGLPFYINASMPWRGPENESFQHLVIAQDTGSAIVGPGRADIFFGLGAEAGARAGAIRHHGQFYLLLPKN